MMRRGILYRLSIGSLIGYFIDDVKKVLYRFSIGSLIGYFIDDENRDII